MEVEVDNRVVDQEVEVKVVVREGGHVEGEEVMEASEDMVEVEACLHTLHYAHPLEHQMDRRIPKWKWRLFLLVSCESRSKLSSPMEGGHNNVCQPRQRVLKS